MVAANMSQMVPVEESCKADEPKIIVIVKDETTNDWQNARSVINLPVSTLIEQLIGEVAKQFHYCPKSFRLMWQSMTGFEEDVTEAGHGEKTLVEMGFYQSRKNTLCVRDKDGLQPLRMDGTVGKSYSFTYAASLSLPAEAPVYGPPTLAQSGRRSAVDEGCPSQNPDAPGNAVPLVADSSTSPSHPYAASTSDFSYSHAVAKSETGYVGLVNQAMTCYLNSLLQTLFMTPEFRNAVYRWDYDGPMEEEALAKSIPFQLQRLFLALQTSKKRAVETTDITKSFGWDSSEAWQQHDIQELCRILFEALETKWRKTDQRDLINQLYQGKMKDYVKCLECGYESARMDSFLDIPLTVRPFGSTTSYGSVEEALEAFVATETLDGNNQYSCEKCGKKCDARKGLKFSHFPYILTMQMKRFDFDYNTLQRIKLNERMTFPEILNLNRFTSEDESMWKTNHDHENEDAFPRGWTRPSPTAATSNSTEARPQVEVPQLEPHQKPPPDAPPLPPGGLKIPGSGDAPRSFKSGTATAAHAKATKALLQEEDEGIDMEPTSHSNLSPSSGVAAKLDSGPYIYELFSVMIHSGSANGGHYYAYIKSFADGGWYSFNDQHVQKITVDDVFKTFGSGGGGGDARSYHYQSSVNAYMLMYRQIHPSNASFINVDNFPPHIVDISRRERERDEAERKQREVERSTCKIKLFCLLPSSKTLTEFRFEVHKDKTLREATADAFSLCRLEAEGVDPADARIVKYDEYHDAIERSYGESEMNETMESILGGVKSSYMFDLLLEIKQSYTTFQTYKPGGTTVKVHLVDLLEESVHPFVNVRAQLSHSVEDFKALAAKALNLKYVDEDNSDKKPTPVNAVDEDEKPPRLPRKILKRLHCVFERYHNDLRYLGNPSKSLKSEGFFRSNKVFLNYDGPDSDLARITECQRISESEEIFKASKLYSLLDRHNHTIRLRVTMPREAPYPPGDAPVSGASGGSDSSRGGASHASAPSSVLSAAPSCESGYATSTSVSIKAPNSRLNADEGDSERMIGRSDDRMDTSLKATATSMLANKTEEPLSVPVSSSSPPSIRRNNVPHRRRAHTATPTDASVDSGTSGSSSSTRTLIADDDVDDNDAANSRRLAATNDGSGASPPSSLVNSPGTVSPFLESPSGEVSGNLDCPAGVTVVGGGKGWSFPEVEDPLDDCMLPESASGRVSPAEDPSEEEADNSPDNSQANAKIESWRTEMSRNWIRDMNSRQLRGEDDDDGDGVDSDKETQIGTWDNKEAELEGLVDETMPKFCAENMTPDSTAALVGTDVWTHSGAAASGSKDWEMGSGSVSPEMMATSPPATSADSAAMSCESASPADVGAVSMESADFGTAFPQTTSKTDDGKVLNVTTKESNSASLAPSNSDNDISDDDVNRFFRASLLQRLSESQTESNSGDDAQNVLLVEVDKRITLGTFKKRLEPWLGTSTDNFKVFRVYPNQQEFESTRLQETLTAFSDDGRMTIKYGRALRKGEYRVKVYLLDLTQPNEPPKILCETVFAKEMTVLEAKRVVLAELRRGADSRTKAIGDLTPGLVRLRKRAWKNPGTIFLDEKAFDTDIPIFANWEVFLQILNEPQPLMRSNFVAVFLRRWRPSAFAFDAFQEVILFDSSVDELRSSIADVSGIPLHRISFAKGRGTFPCDVNPFDIDSELDWDPPNVKSLNVWPLYICDDGNVIFYRDKEEKLKELDEAQRSALQQQQQDTRNGRVGTQVTFSPRKERPLRIKVYSESEDLAPVDSSCENINGSSTPSTNKKTRPSSPTCGSTDID